MQEEQGNLPLSPIAIVETWCKVAKCTKQGVYVLCNEISMIEARNSTMLKLGIGCK